MKVLVLPAEDLVLAPGPKWYLSILPRVTLEHF